MKAPTHSVGSNSKCQGFADAASALLWQLDGDPLEVDLSHPVASITSDDENISHHRCTNGNLIYIQYIQYIQYIHYITVQYPTVEYGALRNIEKT